LQRHQTVAALILCSSFAWADVKVERKPLSIGGFVDIGQVVNADSIKEPQSESFDPTGMMLNRTAAGVTQEIVVEDRLWLRVSVGGMFFNVAPQIVANPKSLPIKFGPGIEESFALYKWGDPKASKLEAQVGLFKYKYNPDAFNMGEYLFRANTYPGILYKSTWSWMNREVYDAKGLRLAYTQLQGALRHELLLVMESNNFPAQSFSPGYVGTWSLGGILEMSAGVQFQHLVPVKPSWLTRKDRGDAVWVEFPNIPDTIPLFEGNITYNAPSKTPRVVPVSDTLFPGSFATFKGDAQQIMVDTGGGNLAPIYDVYPHTETPISFRGIKTMARLSLDMGRMLGIEGAGPFRIFTEAALLGIEDQPFYYDNIAERMPVMVGMNVPTFGLLDLLAFQVEWYGNNALNSMDQYYAAGVPIPERNGYSGTQLKKLAWEHDPSDYHADDWKWAIQAKKNLIPGLNANLAVASDHLRTVNILFLPSANPVMNRPAHWYYLFRLEYGW
jgi:hypothetical protein